MKTTIVIPCLARHVSLLGTALSHISEGTILPDEILIVVSPYQGSNNINNTINELRRKYDNILNTKWFFSKKRLSCAQARDYLTPHINGDLVLYHDADDYQHPQRIEIVKRFFEDMDIVHLCHGYSLFEQGCYGELEYEKIKTMHGSVIYDSFFAMKFGSVPFGTGFKGELSSGISTGVSCVKKEILEKIKFDVPRKKVRMEDYYFCCSVWKQFNKTLLVDAPLYIYTV